MLRRMHESLIPSSRQVFANLLAPGIQAWGQLARSSERAPPPPVWRGLLRGSGRVVGNGEVGVIWLTLGQVGAIIQA